MVESSVPSKLRQECRPEAQRGNIIPELDAFTGLRDQT